MTKLFNLIFDNSPNLPHFSPHSQKQKVYIVAVFSYCYDDLKRRRLYSLLVKFFLVLTLFLLLVISVWVILYQLVLLFIIGRAKAPLIVFLNGGSSVKVTSETVVKNNISQTSSVAGSIPACGPIYKKNSRADFKCGDKRK